MSSNQKIMYDASIHLGQFSLNEETRIRCKNSQAMISSKKNTTENELEEVIGVVTFVENTWTDYTVRENLGRTEQDYFYRRMDTFHSLQNIQKIDDSRSLIKKFALHIEEQTQCQSFVSNIVAAALVSETYIIHTLYKQLLEPRFVQRVSSVYDIEISLPPLGPEKTYQGSEKDVQGNIYDMESCYQKALVVYREKNINLLDHLLALQKGAEK